MACVFEKSDFIIIISLIILFVLLKTRYADCSTVINHSFFYLYTSVCTIVSIVSCRCTYCCRETSHGKITRHYSRYCAVAFCYVHKCELSYMCPGHDIKLHPHRVKIISNKVCGIWLGFGEGANVIISK